MNNNYNRNSKNKKNVSQPPQQQNIPYANSVNMPPIYWDIPVFYRSNNGGSFLETTYFGYRITISTDLQPFMGSDGNLYLHYNINEAVLYTNKNGYPNLYIGK